MTAKIIDLFLHKRYNYATNQSRIKMRERDQTRKIYTGSPFLKGYI